MVKAQEQGGAVFMADLIRTGGHYAHNPLFRGPFTTQDAVLRERLKDVLQEQIIRDYRKEVVSLKTDLTASRDLSNGLSRKLQELNYKSLNYRKKVVNLKADLAVSREELDEATKELLETKNKLSSLMLSTVTSVSLPEERQSGLNPDEWAVFKDFEVKKSCVTTIERGRDTLVYCEDNRCFGVDHDEMSYDDVVKAVRG